MQSTQSEPLVVGVSGSLNDDSVTRLTVTRALDTAADRGARTELVDLREYELPMVDPNVESPDDAERLGDRIAAADALLLGTPMYNGSYASPLKTAIDHSDPDSFEDLPVGLLGVAGGQFPRRALDHLRAVASHMGARVLPHEVAVAESYRIDDALPDEIGDRVDELGHRTYEATLATSETCRVAAAADD